MIDIIIPAYHCHNTIIKTISSIVEQSYTDVEVTIVNDGDTQDYSEFVNLFNKYIKIKEIKLENNSGPASARQYGIENTSNPYIMFIDGDDVLFSPKAIEILYNNIILDNVACVFSDFIQDNITSYQRYTHNNTWLHGKIYKREFLVNHNIKFLLGSRANEDAGFNLQCKLNENVFEQVYYINEPTYLWICNENSITRKDNCLYSYTDSFEGYVNNLIFALSNNKESFNYESEVFYGLCNLYQFYIECLDKCDSEEICNKNLSLCKKYYIEVIKNNGYNEIEINSFNRIYFNSMLENYKNGSMEDIIPKITFYDFLNILKEEG